MKTVIVHPERCVGCMQCMLACAVAHSRSKQLYAALAETPRPNARIHVGVGLYQEGFPNRCRHCDPAPCISACLADAIFRDSETATVLINPDRCINCASCAMACPYGVIRFHEDPFAPPGHVVAVKCDNCDERRANGQLPACVEICKSGALTYEEISTAMRRKTDEVARSISTACPQPTEAAGWNLLNSVKRARLSL
jgi:anaerobic carbon-monoxide dehydrogenase iron sulfur subunit